MEILESSASSTIEITKDLIDQTARLTGDRNWVHMKETRMFNNKRIAHGITLTGFIMDLITKLKPEQLVKRLDLNMHWPASLGDRVRTQIDVEGNMVIFKQFNQDEKLLIDGTAEIAQVRDFLLPAEIKSLDLNPQPYDMNSLQFPEVGVRGSTSTTITRDLIEGMAELTGDQHPFELEKSIGLLKAHDQILTGFASNMVANYLPGSGSIMKTVGFTVYRPAFAGETITVVAEIVESHLKQKRLAIKVEMTNDKNELLLTGQSEVLFLIMQGSARKALLEHLEELKKSNMEIEISLAKASDLEEIAQLVNSAYRGDSSRKGWTTEADLLGGQRVDSAMLAQQLTNKNENILCARFKDQTKIVGCVAVLLEDENKIYIGMVTVDPTIQAQGIGRQLLSAAEKFGQSKNCVSAYMTVIHQRHTLIEWYERRGYKKNGDVVQFPEGPQFGIPQTKDLHLVVMTKPLHREQ